MSGNFNQLKKKQTLKKENQNIIDRRRESLMNHSSLKGLALNNLSASDKIKKKK